MDEYFSYYATLEQQRWMVADNARTDAFAAAIAEVVKPGDVVIDVGAGTGLLSLLAAKAGARRVIGIERSNMANIARDLIEQNGYQNVIEIFYGDAKNLQIDEKADVIVSEWLGHLAYVEGMFRSVIHVRDAWLKPNGKLIPSAVDVLMAPIDDQESYIDRGPGFWEQSKVHGIDFSSLTKKELQMGHANQDTVPQDLLLAPGQLLNTLNCKKAARGDEWCHKTVEYQIRRNGILNGFVGWFSTQLSPNVVLDTGPHCLPTHWRQTYFPYYPTAVKEGDVLKVEFNMEEPEGSWRLMEVSIRTKRDEVKYIVS